MIALQDGLDRSIAGKRMTNDRVCHRVAEQPAPGAAKRDLLSQEEQQSQENRICNRWNYLELGRPARQLFFKHLAETNVVDTEYEEVVWPVESHARHLLT